MDKTEIENRSDEELIILVQKGQTELFSYIVERYYKKIFSLIFNYLYNIDETEDVTQEVFLKCFKKLHQFRFKSSFNTWLYRIAVNIAIDTHKENVNHKNMLTNVTRTYVKNKEHSQEMQNPLYELIEQDNYSNIINALTQVKSIKQKNVFILKHLEGLSIAQISNITKMNESTVKTHLLRCLRKIKNSIGESYNGI